MITERKEVSETKISDDITIKKALVTSEVREIYWKGVKLPSDFLNLLWELRDCDGVGNRLVINNKAVADLLVDEGAAFGNIRGSFGGNSKRIEEIYEMFEPIWYAED